MPRRAADPAAAGELAAAILGGRTHVDVTVPRTTVRGAMRLLTRSENRAVRTAARAACRAAGVPDASLEISRDWLEEVATRTIAIAMRQPGNTSLALASIEEWEDCDDEQIAALWERYKDLEEEFDPLGDGGADEAAAAELIDAAKKKDVALLMSFGSRRLARFATSLVALPAT